MRVTGTRLLDLTTAAITSNQERVGEASAQVSSGLRVQTASEDPVAWMTAQRARARQLLAEGASAALRSGRDQLDATDAALAGVSEAVMQLRALAVQGASDTSDAPARNALAIEVRGLFQAALASANAQSSDGEFLLAGSASLGAAFSSTGVYLGDATSREVPTAAFATLTATVSGAQLTSAAGVDVLQQFERVAAALAANDGAGVRALLADLDTAVRQTALARTTTGTAMHGVDAAIAAHDALDDRLAGEIASAIEADPIAAASELARAGQALDASRAVSSHVAALVDPRRG